MNRVGLLPTTHRCEQDSRHSRDSRQTKPPSVSNSRRNAIQDRSPQAVRAANVPSFDPG